MDNHLPTDCHMEHLSWAPLADEHRQDSNPVVKRTGQVDPFAFAWKLHEQANKDINTKLMQDQACEKAFEQTREQACDEYTNYRANSGCPLFSADINKIDTITQYMSKLDLDCRSVSFHSAQDFGEDCLDQLIKLGRINHVHFGATDSAYIFGEQCRPKLAKLLSQVISFHPDNPWDDLVGLLKWFDQEQYSFDNIQHLRINNLQMLHVDMWDLLWEAFPHVETIEYHDYTEGHDSGLFRSIVTTDNEKLADIADQFGIEANTPSIQRRDYLEGVERGCRHAENAFSDELCGHPNHEGRHKHACKLLNPIINLAKQNEIQKKKIEELKNEIEAQFGLLA